MLMARLSHRRARQIWPDRSKSPGATLRSFVAMREGLVTIITGSSRGFGELTAETLARRGHRVFAGMREPRGRNAPAAARIRTLASDHGLPLEPIELDVTDDTSVAAAVECALAAAGRIDVVVNNAGALYFGITEAFTTEQLRAQLDVSLFGPARLNRAALPHMRERGSGLLVHVSSIAGRLTWPFFGLYCAGKYALEALAEAYRYELSEFGVDSVIIEPGPFPTDLVSARVGPDEHERVASYGRVAQTASTLIAGLEEMLASSGAPDPQAVADVIADLIETPPGQRPLRTVVGEGFGAAGVNAGAELHARKALESFGLGHLAQILTEEVAA